MALPDSPYAIGASANESLLNLFAAKFQASEPDYFRQSATLDLVDMVVEAELKAPPTFHLGPVRPRLGAAAELGLALPAAAPTPEPDVEVRFSQLEVRTFALEDGGKGEPLDTLELAVRVAGALVVDDREASIVSLQANVEGAIADRTLSHVLSALLRNTFAAKVQGWALPRVSNLIGSDLDLEIEDAEVAPDAIWVYGSLEPSELGARAAPARVAAPGGGPAGITAYVRQDALGRAIDTLFVPPRPQYEAGGSKLGFGYRLDASATVGGPELRIEGGRAQAGLDVSGRASLRIKTPIKTFRIPLAAGRSRARVDAELSPDASGRCLMLGLSLVGSSLRLHWKAGGVLSWIAPIVDLALSLLTSAFAPLIGEAVALAVGRVELRVFQVPEARIPGTDLEAEVAIERIGFERDCATVAVAVK